jgi:2'-5' RNA ligase
VADQDTESKGGMIALLPADPDALAVDVEGAEAVEQIHLTLQFLGSDITGWDAHRRDGVVIAARAAAADIDGPIAARVVGHATFAPGQDAQCAVHLIGDSDVLAPLHEEITDRCAELLGDDHHPQHTPYLPHVTVGYGLDASQLTYTGPVVFDRILVKLAGVSTVIPLVDALTTAAREAFAHGWALSGGPMTERVHAACEAAIRIVHEADDTDAALAATIQLGTLAGTWAELYQRREQLVAKHTAAISVAWRQLMSHVDVDGIIRKLRKQLGMVTEAAPGDSGPDKQGQTAAARAEAEAGLHTVIYPASPDYQATAAAIGAALKDGEAEGYASGVAIAAEQQGAATVSFDLAFEDAYAALGSLGDTVGDEVSWLGRVLDGQASDLGNALAAVAREGGSFEDMQAAAADVLDSEAFRSVDTIIDLAMSQSFSRGATTLYAREGVQTVDYVTAGGARVCPLCLDVESKNPWNIREVPHPGLHPYCRCVLMPADPLEVIRAMNLSRYTSDEALAAGDVDS